MELSINATEYEDIPKEYKDIIKSLSGEYLDNKNRNKNYKKSAPYYIYKSMEDYEFFYRYIFDIVKHDTEINKESIFPVVEVSVENYLKMGLLANNYCASFIRY